MELVCANDEDSESLKAFLESFTLPGRMDLRPQKIGDIFNSYKMLSDNFKVFLLKNKKGEIKATTAVNFRNAYIDGEIEQIGFIRDLHIAQEREALSAWMRVFLPALKKELKEHQCRYFFSALSKQSANTYQTVLRPKRRQQVLPRYYLLRKFHMVALHGRIPFLLSPLKTIDIMPLEEKDISALVQYLNHQSRERPLGKVFDEESFLKTFKTWPGLDMSHFLVAKDKQGNIIGSCAPWSPSEIESLKVENQSGTTSLVRLLFTMGSPVRLTRRIAKVGENFQLSFLTHLFADNPDVFFSLLHEAWNHTPKNHTLLYPNFYGEIKTRPPKNFIYTKSPYSIYTILPPQDKLPNILRPRLQSPAPFFEPTLL